MKKTILVLALLLAALPLKATETSKSTTLLMAAVYANDVVTIKTLCNDPDTNVYTTDLKSKYTKEVLDYDTKLRAQIKLNSKKIEFPAFVSDEMKSSYRTAYRIRTYIKQTDGEKSSALIWAIVFNRLGAMELMLERLETASDKSSFKEYLNQVQKDEFTLIQIAVSEYDANEENSNLNLAIIRLLINNGASPKENELIKGNNRVDTIALAALADNGPAIKYFKAYFLHLAESDSPIASAILKDKLGTVEEVKAKVFYAQTLAQQAEKEKANKELSEWKDIFNGKCLESELDNLVLRVSNHGIYNDDKFIAKFKLTYFEDKTSGKICDVKVSDPISAKGTEKIKLFKQISTFYDQQLMTHKADSRKEAYVMISWTATLYDDYGISGNKINKVSYCSSRGIIKIESSEVSIIESSEGSLK